MEAAISMKGGRHFARVTAAWCAWTLAMASPATAAARENWETLARQGADAFRAQDFEVALDLFRRAYELNATPYLLVDLALAEINAHRPLEAAAHFRSYLTFETEPQWKLEAIRTKWLPRAEAQLARISLVVPVGAEVFVDGQRIISSVGTIEVVAGEHVVLVSVAGRFEEHCVNAPVGTTVTMRADEPPSACPGVPVASVGEQPQHCAAARAKWMLVRKG